MKCIYVSIVITLGASLSLSPASRARILFTESTQSPRISGIPENLGYPRDGTRRGGGSRGEVCALPSEVPPLTALMPDTATWTDSEPEREFVLSFTKNPSPDLWFYLPYRLDETSQVKFTLKNAAGDRLKRVRLNTVEQIPKSPSIISVSLSQLELVLTAEMDYHWYLTVECVGGPPVVVDGWLRHRPSDLVDNAAVNSRRFFVDSLSILANAQLANPNDSSVQSAWQDLLNAVGLGDIDEIPLMDCCSFIE